MPFNCFILSNYSFFLNSSHTFHILPLIRLNIERNKMFIDLPLSSIIERSLGMIKKKFKNSMRENILWKSGLVWMLQQWTPHLSWAFRLPLGKAARSVPNREVVDVPAASFEESVKSELLSRKNNDDDFKERITMSDVSLCFVFPPRAGRAIFGNLGSSILNLTLTL